MKKQKPKTEKPDYINVIISDVHSGSDRAAVPDGLVLPPLMADEKERPLYPTKLQLGIYNHLISCGAKIKQRYPRHKKVITVNGDAIEGLHHKTIQLAAPTLDDHIEIHLHIMRRFLKEVDYSPKNGDVIHYVSGTEAHTGYSEAYIAERINNEFEACKFHDTLKLHQNGKNIWFAHQWAQIGNGHNEGNAIGNSLKAMFYNSLKEGWDMPDLVVGSHFHKSGLGSFTQNWRTYHAVVTPSMQRKTRFAHQKTAFQRNDIGIVCVEVTRDGLFDFAPMLMPKDE